MIILLIIFIVAFVLTGGTGAKLSKKDKAFEFWPEPILGNASYTTAEECKAAGLFSAKGIPCGYVRVKGWFGKKLKALRYNGDAMAITIAPVGAGKGVSQIIPACLSMDDRTLIVVSPKGETPAVAGKHRAKLGPCFYVAPYGGTFYGEKTAHHNQMDILNDAKQSPNDFYANARSIAEGLVFRETSSSEGEFFSSSAVNLVQSVIMGVARHEPKEKRTLQRVAEIICSNEIFTWSNNIAHITNDPFLKRSVGTFACGHDEDRTLMAVLQTARTSLAVFNDPCMTEYMSKSDFHYEDGRKRIMTIFLIFPVNRQDVSEKVLYSEINFMLNRLMSPGRGKKKVTIILDDFSSYGAPPAVERAIGIAREFGVQLWLILQDLNQLEGRYPNGRFQVFLSNAGLRVFMTPQDQKSATYLSEQIGITTVSGWQKSLNFGEEIWPWDTQFKEGWSCPPHARPLVHPHEARALPQDQMYVFARGLANVIKATKIPYFKLSEYRGKFRANPFFGQSFWAKWF